MTITMFQMYWITRLDDIGCVFTLISAVFGLATAIMLVGTVGFPDNDPGWYPEKAKFFYRFGIIFLGITIFNSLIPSTKDMAAILVVPRILNNQQVQQMPSKIMDLATLWLDALKPKEK